MNIETFVTLSTSHKPPSHKPEQPLYCLPLMFTLQSLDNYEVFLQNRKKLQIEGKPSLPICCYRVFLQIIIFVRNEGKPVIFKEMSDNQRRVYIDTAQLYEAFMAAYHKSRAYRGGMHWKKAKGREYLFRSRDRYGYGKSLGPPITGN